ncbi:DNA mismatch repair endonuclease MutL [Bombilactobacillus bombi]|uniref:DNA mismatch repair endonuclease MutL n=1 Tax=Bombilactobacillus bombi TaxID=1303590 RepID=UPI0015E60B5E|nr:DNA mismatch repair endonuclease MutL [Bombilactobacillus bombi]MBA1434530.1 DNA mismatch repair endonuclease MutL [Bombilactobacillus bombi]
MAHIQRLSPTLSNQIAAGEVIERPASVVKELVENAIDAQASQIDIVVKDAGISYIKVTDNGQGIASEEVEMAFQPHATSKISTNQDLFNVKTLGFRGEALASIAAVAKVSLTTSTDGRRGVLLQVAGGQQLHKQTVAAAQGTSVEVADLFYNTPARLKYIKTVNTELNRIIDIVNRLALAQPQIAFTLVNEQRNLIRTSGNGNLQQTLAGIYSRKAAEQMVALATQTADFKISGLTSLPQQTRASRNYISLLINGRYIVNYRLTQALLAGYGSKLMVGRYPIAVLQIQMDPLLVDVNVHPTKREVRLSKEEQVAALIQQTIADKLGQLNLIQPALNNLPTHTVASQPESLPFLVGAEEGTQIAEPQPFTATKVLIAPEAVNLRPIFKDPQHLQEWDLHVKKFCQHLGDTNPISSSEKPLTAQVSTAPFPELRFLAQIHGSFLLAESDNGFYLVDQHAAQERVNYEKFRQEVGQVSHDQQQLLVPLVLDYPNSDAIVINERLNILQAVGLGISSFGQNSFVVQSHPSWIPTGQEEATIREIIDYVLKDGKISIAKFREQTAITMSCRLSIKANHHLDRTQAQAILDQLAQAKNPYNCPHGRPTLVHFSDQDIKKMFKRIQDPHQSRRVK